MAKHVVKYLNKSHLTRLENKDCFRSAEHPKGGKKRRGEEENSTLVTKKKKNRFFQQRKNSLAILK